MGREVTVSLYLTDEDLEILTWKVAQMNAFRSQLKGSQDWTEEKELQSIILTALAVAKHQRKGETT